MLLLALQSFKTIMTSQYLNAFDSGVAAGAVQAQSVTLHASPPNVLRQPGVGDIHFDVIFLCCVIVAFLVEPVVT